MNKLPRKNQSNQSYEFEIRIECYSTLLARAHGGVLGVKTQTPSIMTVFVTFQTPPLYERYPWYRFGPYHPQRSKRFSQVLHSWQFLERYFQLFKFYANFCKMLDPPLCGGTPSVGPALAILQGFSVG